MRIRWVMMRMGGEGYRGKETEEMRVVRGVAGWLHGPGRRSYVWDKS